MTNHRLIHADVLEGLRHLETASVQCCVTSPPYWGLRDYGIEPSVWGGSPDCSHEWGGQERGRRGDILPSEESSAGRLGTRPEQTGLNDGGRFCRRCEAWRGCPGLEPTPDLFIQHTVEVFRQVRRVLHPSGTLWLNLGDCYCTKPHGNSPSFDPKYAGARDRCGDRRANRTNDPESIGLKSKDLAMVPARIALALQADGWYLRSQIPWLKRNGMPESAEDRPTSMVEYIFLFAKSEDCYYDREAVRIAASSNSHARGNGVNPKARQMGPNSRMNRDHDPARQTAAKIKAKQNRSFSAAVAALLPSRARRNSDWFFESWQGLLPDEQGDPLVLIVNPQPFSIEMCAECETVYAQRDYRKLPKDPVTERRVCACGSQKWISHFATFPERMVVPCILAGTSEHGCCAHCGAPYERIIERQVFGDLHPDQDRKNAGINGNWPKESRLNSKASPDGSQFSTSRLDLSTRAARSASKHAQAHAARNGDPVNSLALATTHDQPFPAPATLGWRPTCSHPLFPAGDPVPCVVLDPFAGSGRAGLAAMKLGRHFIGIERSSRFIKMAEWQLTRSCFPAPEVSA